jgi:hypothetical protein
MKNKNEIFGLAANILAVLLLLAFVVVGLNKIGLYSLPESVERLIGIDKDSDALIDDDDEQVYSLIGNENKPSSVSVAELDYTNARIILENLKPSQTYIQNVVVTHHFGNSGKIQNLSVIRNKGLYEIVISDSKNVPLKTIKETSHHVVINSGENEEEKGVVLPKGDFDMSSECGFVVNVDEFLKFSDSLNQADFSKFSDDNGSFLVVSFESELENILYSQQYTVSLDYGIVTKAVCYENEELVYEMITTSLTD